MEVEPTKNLPISESQISNGNEAKNLTLESAPPGQTPLSTVLAIHKAVLEKNWNDAGQYLDMRYLPQHIVDEGAGELIRKLAIVWGQQKIVDLANINDTPQGMIDDNVPSYRDLIGVLESSNGPIPVYLQRVPDGKGGKVWKISNATVTQIPQLWQEFGYSAEIESIGDFLPVFTFINMNNWQFVAFILLIVFAWLITGGLRAISLLIFSSNEKSGPMLERFWGKSVRMFLFFILIDYGSNFLGLSLSAKLWITVGTLKYLASTYLILGLMELFTAIYLMRANTSSYSAAIIRPLMTTLKIIVVLLIALNWFESAGYNIATILTGLGIGSLAIALAAQKTLENVFGAFTIYIAKPIQPGDFCKFGDVYGTVEEIGLRSTRIRKLNRSVVHVPNSVFSSKELENFSEIDRRHYKQEFRFRLDTSTDQLRQLLIQLRDLLLQHERVLPTAARARFELIERDAFVVVVNCYVDTKSIVDFKAVAEDLNLYILDIIRDLGMEWAIPQQQVLLGQATLTNEARVEEAKVNMDELRANEKLPFPDFSETDITERENKLSYPAKGTVNLNTAASSDVINEPEGLTEPEAQSGGAPK